MRHYALVFKTENTVKELKKLQFKLIETWEEEDIKYILQIYKNSLKDG